MPPAVDLRGLDPPEPLVRILAAIEDAAGPREFLLSREPYPHRDLWPRLHPVIEAFGPERLMWGSDYTRLRMGVGTTDRGPREEWGGLYSDAVNYLRDTSELSEADKATIFAGTIRRVLEWPLTKV